MNAEQIREVIHRIDGVWPPRTPPTHEERAEWVRFLQPMDGPVALAAVDELRESSKWRPSMADFRTAYYAAAALPGDDFVALPAGDEKQATPALEDVYGTRREQWVYCWRCDMALSLMDMEDNHVYEERRGLRHSRCPASESAPLMPTQARLEREEHWRKMKIGRD